MTKAQLQQKIEELEAQISRLKNPQTDDDKAEIISICIKTLIANCSAVIVIYQLGPDYEADTQIGGNILAVIAMAYNAEGDVTALISSGFEAAPELLDEINKDNDKEEPYKDSDDDED